MSVIFMIKGAMGSGKDEISNYLVSKFGFTRLAFGDHIRKAVYALNPILKCDSSGMVADRLQDIVDKHGWDFVKRNYPEARRLLQVMGSEVGREQFGSSVWANKVCDQLSTDRKEIGTGLYVIPDFRYLDEYSYFRYNSSNYIKLIKVIGRGEGDSHKSEEFQCNEEDFKPYGVNSGDMTTRPTLSFPISIVDNSKSLEILHYQIDNIVLSTMALLTDKARLI